MNTPTQMKTSSASLAGIMPSATLSCTAFATANCAGPNIWTACLAPLMVTLLNSTLLGLQGRFGAITASKVVKPSFWLASALQNAVSTGLPRGPMSRSICATSLPSPMSDSPTMTFEIFAMPISSQRHDDGVQRCRDRAGARWTTILVGSARLGGPVGWIAAEAVLPLWKFNHQPFAYASSLPR